MSFLADVSPCVIVSVVSLAGVFALLIRDKTFKSLLFLFIGLSAGALTEGRSFIDFPKP